jgi:Protein of unknown function with PCYCGC motif
MKFRKFVTPLLGFAGVALVTTVALVASQGATPKTSRPQDLKTSAKSPSGPVRTRVSTPPLPNVGFAPVRPMDVVRATYDFAAQHPEILKYVPCYCGCGEQGHKANESCFVARRDAKGNVLQWDEHGFGCTICVDVARESMQLYNSGAGVQSIRAAIEKRWAPGNAAGRTPTPAPPGKK